MGRAHERMEQLRGRHVEWRGRLGRVGDPFADEDKREVERRKREVDMQVVGWWGVKGVAIRCCAALVVVLYVDVVLLGCGVGVVCTLCLCSFCM